MLLPLAYSQLYTSSLSSQLSAICLTTIELRPCPPGRYNYYIYADPERTIPSCTRELLMQTSSLPSGTDNRKSPHLRCERCPY
jgi:hypothetical protein